MCMQLPSLELGEPGSGALKENWVSVVIGFCVFGKEKLVESEGLVGVVLEFEVGAHDGVPCEGVGVVKMVEDSEGIVEGNESGARGEVYESACGVRV